jgi:hypothetical protein
VYRFLAIAVLLDVKDIPQVGPLSGGTISGTTSLFAALDVKAGTVIGKCMSRHRATEFRKFLDEIERNVPADLDIPVIMDNYGTHKTKLIRNWSAKRLPGTCTSHRLQPPGSTKSNVSSLS